MRAIAMYFRTDEFERTIALARESPFGERPFPSLSGHPGLMG
jgi:hypothetical protein